MAKRCGLSQNGRRIWRAFLSSRTRIEGFKLSKDPRFIEKVRDIVCLYLNMKRSTAACLAFPQCSPLGAKTCGFRSYF